MPEYRYLDCDPTPYEVWSTVEDSSVSISETPASFLVAKFNYELDAEDYAISLSKKFNATATVVSRDGTHKGCYKKWENYGLRITTNEQPAPWQRTAV